jgi:hypothetical protein
MVGGRHCENGHWCDSMPTKSITTIRYWDAGSSNIVDVGFRTHPFSPSPMHNEFMENFLNVVFFSKFGFF